MADTKPSPAVVQDVVFDTLVAVTGVEEARSTPDLPIRELGLLDSLGIINLIVALSEKLGIDIVPAEIDESDVATPRAIVEFVRRKLESR